MTNVEFPAGKIIFMARGEIPGDIVATRLKIFWRLQRVINKHK